MINMEKYIGLIRNNTVFLSVFIFLSFSLLLKNLLGVNEPDTLVYAKHFMNPEWIAGDWYLSLGTGYRYPFSVFAGSLAKLMPLWAVALTGRIIVFALFAWLMQRYARHFELEARYIIIFLFMALLIKYMAAHEWILRQFETKSFSYFFIFSGLLALIKKRYTLFMIACGLAVSLHVLIGVYACFAFAIAFLLNFNFFKKDIASIIRRIPLFLLFAAPGIFAIVQNMVDNAGIDSTMAGYIYTVIRDPHHMLPSYWKPTVWIPRIIVFTAFLTLVFIKIKDIRIRIMASFAIGSLALFAAGLCIYAAGAIPLLKYYWFRLPDSVVPFASFLIAAILLGLYAKKSADKRRLGLYIQRLVLILSAAAFIHAAFGMAQNIKDIDFRDRLFFIKKDIRLKEALAWIHDNTEKERSFLVSPFMDVFYLSTERPMFVSFKHVPASEKDILEWYERMKLAAGGNELTGLGFLNRQAVEEAFYGLEDREIKELAGRFGLDYYLGRSGRKRGFKKVFENSEYSLYSLHKNDQR